MKATLPSNSTEITQVPSTLQQVLSILEELSGNSAGISDASEPVTAAGTGPGSSSAESAMTCAGRDNQQRIAAVASLILDQERVREHLEGDRDAMADQIGQNFEELHWLNLLAMVVSTCDATVELQTVAEKVLPDLRTLIRAETIVLMPDADDDDSADGSAPSATVNSRIACVGTNPVDPEELSRLACELKTSSRPVPLVFNRDSNLQPAPLQTSARNLVVVPLLQGGTRYGWLIALNCVASARPGGRPLSDILSEGFGSREAGLLTTAASMLAGHARNLELFRAEERLRLSVIETITAALDARDPNTCGHSQRVGRYATMIAERVGFTPEECERIYVTGLLHDVGKIGVPDNILKKADRLTDEEFEIIKQHPTIGHSILTPLKGLSYVLPGVLHHHERMDGRGYPHGLGGNEIPLEARILAVADSYDAMTSNRTYRNGMEPHEALEILLAGAGQQWDSSVVTAFVASRRASPESTPPE